MSEIRVLQIVDSLSKSSGVMSVIMNFYRKIDRSLIQFDFVVNFEKENNYEKEIIELGGKIFKIDTLRINNLISVYKQISDFFSENKYEIIHSHTPTLTGIYFYIAKKNNVKHRILHSHSSTYSLNKFKYIRNYIMCIPSRKYMTKGMACSKNAGEFLFKKNEKFYVLNNSVDINKFTFDISIKNKVRKELKINNNDIVFGHVGRMELEKNHLLIIDIFYEIYKENKNVKLILVGDGSLRHDIEKKVSNLRLEEKVIFTGIRESYEVMQAMDILIFPSKFEGLPMVCIEAQLLGILSFISNNITNEVEISNLINRIDLNDNPKDISRDILFKINDMNDNKIINIDKKKFDLDYNSKELVNYYFNLIK